MNYWEGSHTTTEASQLRQGADALLNLAAGTAKRRTGTSDIPRLAARSNGDLEIDEEESEDDDNLGE
jgi:hypothetical protein